MRSIFAILCLSTLAFSCTLQQHIHFNKDWSGTLEYRVDISSMKEMMAAMEDSTNSMDFMNNPEMLTALDEMKAIEGISDVNLTESAEGVIKYSYSFSTIDALNRSLSSGSIMDMNGENNASPFFTLNGKKMTYQFGAIAAPAEEEQSMGMDMMEYELKISFDHTVKKLGTVDGASIDDDHTVLFKTDLSELTKYSEKPLKLEIKLK